jgi:hypothetical protein
MDVDGRRLARVSGAQWPAEATANITGEPAWPPGALPREGFLLLSALDFIAGRWWIAKVVAGLVVS